MISDETYDEAIRRPWFVPGAHERAEPNTASGTTCDQCAGQCDIGKRCPRTSPITEPGELAPEREQRSVPGTGLVLSLGLTFGGICLGYLLAQVFGGVAK